jgi:hypothetical protein
VCRSAFWDRVKAAIKGAKTTQVRAAREAGIHGETLKQQIIYNRLPDVEQGHRLAKFLGTTVEYLVDGIEPVITNRARDVALSFDQLDEIHRKSIESIIKGLVSNIS